MQSTESLVKQECHDCGKDINTKNSNILNGVLIEYEDGSDTYIIFKCDECFEKSKTLSNYKPVECYSRIVGYIRPVQSWNKGKSQEFEERKTFNR